MIVAVCGFPRSGTTLAMAMLDAGGLPAYADNRVAFESERILTLPDETAWLADAEGHAVKLLEPLHYTPPLGRDWRFILLRRDPHEQARSYVQFMQMVARVKISPRAVGTLADSFRADYPKMRDLLAERGPVLELAFEDVLADPRRAARLLAGFVALPLDVPAMVACVVPRSPCCYPGLLEMVAVARESTS